MAYERTTVRRARKARPCGDPWCTRQTIKAGDLYYEHVTGPGNEYLGNDRWQRQAECASCAAQRGVPIPGAPTGEDGPDGS